MIVYIIFKVRLKEILEEDKPERLKSKKMIRTNVPIPRRIYEMIGRHSSIYLCFYELITCKRNFLFVSL